MATTIILIILAVALFFILSKGAGLLVGNLGAIADRTKIHPVLIGTLLGFLTTIPEFMVGLNAMAHGMPGLSLGNIWGGIMVIFALILGFSIVLQREIRTDGRLSVILPSFLLIMVSMLLALRGTLHYYDGLMLVGAYLFLVFVDIKTGGNYHKDESVKEEVLSREDADGFWRKLLYWRRLVKREALWALVGLVAVSASSYGLMEIADILLSKFSVRPFIFGLVIFSLGTNLPEISVMLKSIKTRNGNLSFGHLVGSAVSNVLVLSLLTFISPIPVTLDWRYYFMMLFITLAMACVALFYVTRKRFQRWEGAILLAIYILFIAYQLY